MQEQLRAAAPSSAGDDPLDRGALRGVELDRRRGARRSRRRAGAGAPRARRARPGRGARAGAARRGRRPAAASSPRAELGVRRATSSSSARRCTGPSRRRARARRGRGRSRAAAVSVRAAVWPRAAPVPGGSTSSSPRAGVEQYSRADPEPELDQLRRRRPPRAPRSARPGAPAAARCARRARPRRRAAAGGRTGPRAACRRRPRRGARGAGSRTARAARGRWSAARPWRSPSAPSVGAARTDGGPSAADRLPRVAPKLHPGEQVLYEGHPSWRAILDFYLKGIARDRGDLPAGRARHRHRSATRPTRAWSRSSPWSASR